MGRRRAQEQGPDETSEPRFARSRRRLLAGAAGALGLLAGETILAAKPAQAGTDGDVVLGGYNTASALTTIDTVASGTNTLQLNAGGGFSSIALGADSSGIFPTVVSANSGNGQALLGLTAGAQGDPTRGDGVAGITNSSTNAGVYGKNNGTGPAVLGFSNGGGVGVKGTASTSGDGGNAAVSGENTGAGPGVLGSSAGGVGVQGTTVLSGAGVLAQGFGGGAAGLQVVGPSVFNRSGTVSISGMNRSATVSVPGGLTSAALVLATLQSSLAGLWVVSAVPSTSAGSVTITLNQAPGQFTTAKVAWFVVN